MKQEKNIATKTRRHEENTKNTFVKLCALVPSWQKSDLRMRSNRRWIISVFLLLLPFIVSAKENTDHFSKGNDYYQKGDFENAIKEYRELEKDGWESPELYYNLGNAYYKSGNIAASILYYEKAKKLVPGDEETAINLKIANLKVASKIDPLPELFYKRWRNNMAELLSVGDWGILTLVLNFMFFISIAVYLVFRSPAVKKAGFFSALLLMMLTASSYLLGNHRLNVVREERYAILFEPSMAIKSSPTEKGTDLFMLHEGTRMELLDEVGDWSKIRIANGNVGWLPTVAVKKI